MCSHDSTSHTKRKMAENMSTRYSTYSSHVLENMTCAWYLASTIHCV